MVNGTNVNSANVTNSGTSPTNQLIRREAIFQHIKLWLSGDVSQKLHAVLAVVSNCCPPLKGRFLTRYSPVRHQVKVPKGLTPFDLHVLGTPPAFVLSQDQTLKNLYLKPFSEPKIALLNNLLLAFITQEFSLAVFRLRLNNSIYCPRCLVCLYVIQFTRYRAVHSL